VVFAEPTEVADQVAGFECGAVTGGEQVAGVDPGRALVSAQLVVGIPVVGERSDTKGGESHGTGGALGLGGQRGEGAVDAVHTAGDAQGVGVEVQTVQRSPQLSLWRRPSRRVTVHIAVSSSPRRAGPRDDPQRHISTSNVN